MISIEENWDKFKKELSSIEREGMNELISYLENKTDFKTCPASTKFHLCCRGGLAEHSLNVLRFGRHIKETIEVDIPDDSLTIACLLHDVCKTNYYIMGEEWDKEWKEKTNQWRKKPVWKVEDQLPIGHGERSVIVAVRYIPLTTDEIAAIRWHMAWSDSGVHSYYPSGAPFKESLNKYPLLKVLILADEMAELFESLNYKDEESFA